MYISRKLAGIISGLLMVVSAAVIATIDYAELATYRDHIQQACPARWEGHLETITYQQGDSLWQGDLRDKAAFIRYAAEHLKDADGSFKINSFHDDGAVILTCGNLKSKYFTLLNQDNIDVYNSFDPNSLVDTDGDGVNDDMDICADTVAGETVNIVGCAYSQLDDDNDGIPNGSDNCANTQVGETPDANGCALTQLDTDNDGVSDAVDQCIATPVGEQPDASGCAQSEYDSDGDGTPDYLDSYPYQDATQCIGT